MRIYKAALYQKENDYAEIQIEQRCSWQFFLDYIKLRTELDLRRKLPSSVLPADFDIIRMRQAWKGLSIFILLLLLS